MYGNGTQLTDWMHTHGDAVVRACYLLCGGMALAHSCAQRVFICAARERMHRAQLSPQETRALLLSIAVRLCPCPANPPSLFFAPKPLRRLLRLPPNARRVAVLCLYQELPAAQAAAMLGMDEAAAQQLLCFARRTLHT